MKKALLFSAVFSGLAASAQTFTVDDTLSDGQSTYYYIMDSAAVNLSAVTGTGVTWNYATLLAYDDNSLLNEVVDAAGTTYETDFPMAAYNDDLSSGASIYFSNSADYVTVHGYVFAASGMDVVIKHSTDPLISMNYPMAVGDTYTDNIAGEVVIMGTGNATSGSAVVTADGFGTLIVGNNTHTNILRIKLVETINATITVPFPGTGVVTRTLYSYYDLANDKQAIFVHGTIDIASTLLNDNYSAVYYSGDASFVGVEEKAQETAFSVYPNPANNVVTITTDGTSETMTLVNALGQVVATVNNPQMTEAIDVSNFEAGIYIVRLTNDGVISEQKLIVE